MCRATSQVSLRNGLFKTIIWIQLYWLIELCLPADAVSPRTPKQMCRGFPTVTDKWPVQDHLPRTTLLIHRALSHEIPIQMCGGFPSVTEKPPFQDHLSSTTLLTHTALSSGRWSISEGPQQWMCSAVFPSVTDDWPFQDHLLNKTILLTEWALYPKRFPSIFFKAIFWVDLYRLYQLCILGDLNISVYPP